VATFNFDVTANWDTGDANFPVTNQASFETFLSSRDTNETNDLTSIVITDFNLQGNRLQCNLTANGTILDLSYLEVSTVLSVGAISNLNFLGLAENNITNFNPINTIPNTVTYLDLSNNQIESFNPTLNLPNTLTDLSLHSNLMTTAGYVASETWANGMHTAPSGSMIDLASNTDSVSGTNLETILTNKGWTVNV
jgi:hypothetical protein